MYRTKRIPPDAHSMLRWAQTRPLLTSPRCRRHDFPLFTNVETEARRQPTAFLPVFTNVHANTMCSWTRRSKGTHGVQAFPPRRLLSTFSDSEVRRLPGLQSLAPLQDVPSPARAHQCQQLALRRAGTLLRPEADTDLLGGDDRPYFPGGCGEEPGVPPSVWTPIQAPRGLPPFLPLQTGILCGRAPCGGQGTEAGTPMGQAATKELAATRELPAAAAPMSIIPV